MSQTEALAVPTRTIIGSTMITKSQTYMGGLSFILLPLHDLDASYRA